METSVVLTRRHVAALLPCVYARGELSSTAVRSSVISPICVCMCVTVAKRRLRSQKVKQLSLQLRGVRCRDLIFPATTAPVCYSRVNEIRRFLRVFPLPSPRRYKLRSYFPARGRNGRNDGLFLCDFEKGTVVKKKKIK